MSHTHNPAILLFLMRLICIFDVGTPQFKRLQDRASHITWVTGANNHEHAVNRPKVKGECRPLFAH